MKKILSVITIIALGSTGAYAAGTTAGTQIDNSVTLTYTGGPVGGITSNTDSFIVDNKVDLTLATTDAGNVIVQAGATNQVLTFTVTNTGNKVQDYILSQASDGVNNDFVGTTTYNIFVDVNGNGVYDAGTDTDTYIDELAPDTSKTVFIVADIDASENNGDLSGRTLTATAAQGGSVGSLGAAMTHDNASADTAMGEEVVFADGAGDSDASRDGKFSDTSTYEVSTATMSVTKASCIVSDPYNGTTNPKRIPGATVRYAIEVENTGGSDATTVNVSDTLQAGISYSGNASVEVGSCNCASPNTAGADTGTITNAGATVTIDFATVPHTTNDIECAYFEVTID